ncbi:MAG TPA: M23 family metallopeptidase [Bacteroidales bacterium]|nr:M23 family metallopeptidase [Bacteroidales bacterium]
MQARHRHIVSLFCCKFVLAGLLLLTASFLKDARAQVPDYPRDYFRSPVDFKMMLSGTFGEFRPDHFHSGIDIRTGGVEGKPLYAIADGYISRIKISPSGYGKALYVTHPNGYVSVYGHLQDVGPSVHQYLVQEQYRQQSYEIDLFPEKGMFPVIKGEVIAYSGNSGTSGGPHLHFEIRDEATQDPINPLLFGLPVKDQVRPVLSSLKIYAMDAYSTVNGKTDSIVLMLEGTGQGYRLAGPDTITLMGNISFGIQTYDLISDSDRKSGINSVELILDGESVFQFSTQTFSFDQTRFVNSLTDYGEFMTTGRRYLRTAVDPNNKFSGYGTVRNKGILTFDDERTHKLTCLVKDVYGNSSNLVFWVKGRKMTSHQPYLPFPEKFDDYHFMYYLSNTYETGDFKAEIPPGALYDNLVFQYGTSPPLKNTFAKVYRVHHQLTPLHKAMTLWIRPSEKAKGLEDKLYIVLLENDGTGKAVRSTFKDGFVVGQSARFGNFSLMADTLKPTVKPVNFINNKNLAGMSQLKVLIVDEQSGIESYDPTLNGEWILMEYDEKNDLLIYDFDQYLKKGINIFRLEVRDRKDNIRTYEAKLTY